MINMNENDPMYFKTLGYELGSINAKAKTEKLAEDVANNLFGKDSQAKKDFILYYNLGVDSVEVLND